MKFSSLNGIAFEAKKHVNKKFFIPQNILIFAALRIF